MCEGKFGDYVWVTHRYTRKGKYDENRHLELKTWENKPLSKPKRVLLIGKRNVSNGTIEWMGEEGPIYTPETFFSLWLVVERMSSKPFLVASFCPDNCAGFTHVPCDIHPIKKMKKSIDTHSEISDTANVGYNEI